MSSTLNLFSVCSGCFTQQNHVECGLYGGLLLLYHFFSVNPGLACMLVTFLVAVVKHLTEGATAGPVYFGLWFQGTQSTIAGQASRVALSLRESPAAASLQQPNQQAES